MVVESAESNCCLTTILEQVIMRKADEKCFFIVMKGNFLPNKQMVRNADTIQGIIPQKYFKLCVDKVQEIHGNA